MGLMNQMSLEVDELLMTIATVGTVSDLSDELHTAGWRSPTEVEVALRSLREGDLPRAAAILSGHPSAGSEACS